MRLINTESLEMAEFSEKNLPKYAILSHRWGDDEVSLHEYEAGTKTSSQGYDKIPKFCSLAKGRGLKWAWIDTC